MSKEKVFIVVTHKHFLSKGAKKDQKWEVAESVEFVSQLKNRHHTTASAIGDYINQKMISGNRVGMGEYSKFEGYIRTKYAKQMAELDAAYRKDQIPVDESPRLITDQFGNLRPATVFDKV